MTIRLIYKLASATRASLDSVFSDGRELVEDQFRHDDSFRAFQILLCECWKQRERGETGAIQVSEPEGLIKALYNGLREDEPYEWMTLIFGDKRPRDYVGVRSRKKVLVASVRAELAVEVMAVGEGNQEDHPVSEKDIEVILASLLGRKSTHFLDLSILSHSPSGEDKWKIRGISRERSIYYGCNVQIHLSYGGGLSPVVLWFSNNNLYELYPKMDKRQSRVSRPEPVNIGGHHRLTIGELPGIPIDSLAGIEACLALAAPVDIDQDWLKKSLVTFIKANPLTSYKWDAVPIKRHFNGKLPLEKAVHRLGNPARGRAWSSYLLQEVIPEGSAAVLLTLPLVEEL